MANLTDSGIAFLSQWTEGNTNGRRVSCRRVALTLSGQGGTINKIPASVLGLASIEQSSPFVKSDNSSFVLTSPAVDGSFLICSATPTDIASGTWTGVVKGQSL